jgi:Leucine-rich repeat (LRR) protein
MTPAPGCSDKKQRQQRHPDNILEPPTQNTKDGIARVSEVVQFQSTGCEATITSSQQADITVRNLGWHNNTFPEFSRPTGDLQCLKQLFFLKNILTSLHDKLGNLTKVAELPFNENQVGSTPVSTCACESTTELNGPNVPIHSVHNELDSRCILYRIDWDHNLKSSLPESKYLTNNLTSLPDIFAARIFAQFQIIWSTSGVILWRGRRPTN